MASGDGRWRVCITLQRTLRRRILSRSPQWPHSLQHPQQSQSRCCPQGPPSSLFSLLLSGFLSPFSPSFIFSTDFVVWELQLKTNKQTKKVVENPVIAIQSAEGAAHSAIQYFENMKNFLDAVKAMTLLTFEASDLEKV